MKTIFAFALLFVVFVAVSSAAVGEPGQDAHYLPREPRAARSCNNESCRASCILNGHNGGSCNSNDHCDCN